MSTGNHIIDCDFGDDPRSPNYSADEWCQYCGYRIGSMNFSDYDNVCEDCVYEHINSDENE